MWLSEKLTVTRGKLTLDRHSTLQFILITTRTNLLKHPSGLLVNAPCYHGRKLPEASKDMKFFWNGKSHSLVLSSIKATEEGVKPVVRCKWCSHAWRFEWAEVMPYLSLNNELAERLKIYA